MFSVNLKVKMTQNGKIVQDGIKTIYAPDNLASDWVRIGVKGVKPIDEPKLTNAIKVIENKTKGRGIAGGLGFFHNNANNVYHNLQLVGLYSSSFSAEQAGLPIIPTNYRKVAALYTARKVIIRNWENWQDEYMAPNESHPDYDQWNNDAIVYSLFGAKSNQSALREIEYKEKTWNIKNNYFPLSKQAMRDEAESQGYTDLVKDCDNNQTESYTYEILKTLKLSPDAKELLDTASSLIIKSVQHRKSAMFDDDKFHLNAWDAGWYQVRKGILEKHYPQELKEFTIKFKEFEERMREGVYKFGFLL